MREGIGPGGPPGLQNLCGAVKTSQVGSTPTPSRQIIWGHITYILDSNNRGIIGDTIPIP